MPQPFESPEIGSLRHICHAEFNWAAAAAAAAVGVAEKKLRGRGGRNNTLGSNSYDGIAKNKGPVSI